VFEPQPGLLPNLRRTIAAMSNAKLMECALSDRIGEVVFHVPEHGYHMMASLAPPPVESKPVVCPATTLDTLLNDGVICLPDFIKIDVEGAEAVVFRGAAVLLNQSHAPLVFFEQWSEAAERLSLGRTEAADALLALPAAEYTLYECAEDRLWPLTNNSIAKGNLLAVPVTRQERIGHLLRN
jgi:FkbM family methyltransferase